MFRMLLIFCQTAQYWDREYNTANALFSANQFADIFYVSENK